MIQLQETAYALKVGDVYFPDEGRIMLFSHGLDATEYLIDVQPFPESALRVQMVLIEDAFKYTKDVGARLCLDRQVIYDAEAVIH